MQIMHRKEITEECLIKIYLRKVGQDRSEEASKELIVEIYDGKVKIATISGQAFSIEHAETYDIKEEEEGIKIIKHYIPMEA